MPHKNLDKAHCFRETRYFVWKFENFDKLQLSYSSIFFAETSHTFPTYQCLQRGVGFFLFQLDLELFAKIIKDLVSTQSCFTLLLITQDLNKIKNSHTRFCRHLELLKVFNFSAKKPGFLEIIKVCLNAGIRFFITWLLPNYKKIVRINQFWINHASHLK